MDGVNDDGGILWRKAFDLAKDMVQLPIGTLTFGPHPRSSVMMFRQECMHALLFWMISSRVLVQGPISSMSTTESHFNFLTITNRRNPCF